MVEKPEKPADSPLPPPRPDVLARIEEGRHRRRVAQVDHGFDAQMKRFEKLRASNEEFFRKQRDRFQDSKGTALTSAPLPPPPPPILPKKKILKFLKRKGRP